ncbi:MAG: formate dehydrogenase accessory sulfurtransferase FdhD [Bryobacteraceae bacterium]
MRRNILTVPVRRVGVDQPDQDWVAVEEPLQIRLDGRDVAITMRTPGHDRELAAGFLFTEGILKGPEEIADIELSSGASNSVEVRSVDGVEIDFAQLDRHSFLSSSCGVCGKTSIETLQAIGCASPARDGFAIEAEVLYALPDALRATQLAFDRTGGLHAAGLFDAAGTLVDTREDVGRHNAVDKLIGAALLRGAVPLSGCLMLVSGRVSFELVQKALMAGIPMLAAVGAPSSLAVDLALRYGMTLAGFVRGRRFNVYTGDWRIRGM